MAFEKAPHCKLINAYHLDDATGTPLWSFSSAASDSASLRPSAESSVYHHHIAQIVGTNMFETRAVCLDNEPTVQAL